ncbi:hypothetical protein HAX54_027980 [Datura stramonium]|uniref:peroxidase n=1 Tax=Datura stramonium TaxID=4076 RepID=A0ABS8S949_DATST|nr:hypothetical protein [Datura stramonium]
MDSKGFNVSILALFVCLILSFSVSSIVAYRTPWPPIKTYLPLLLGTVPINWEIYYDVQAGRRDGRVSIDSETLTNLPSPFVDARELIRNLRGKVCAHSIGIAHCAVFANRLYPQNNQQNLPIDPEYADFLKSICPPEALTNGTGVS